MEEKTIIIKQGSFGSFLRGLAIGAVVALLFAPRAGEETRGMLMDRGMEVRDKAMSLAQDTRDRAQGYVQDARNKINETIKGVKDTTTNDTNKELKRELEIMEEVNNPNYNV